MSYDHLAPSEHLTMFTSVKHLVDHLMSPTAVHSPSTLINICNQFNQMRSYQIFLASQPFYSKLEPLFPFFGVDWFSPLLMTILAASVRLHVSTLPTSYNHFDELIIDIPPSSKVAPLKPSQAPKNAWTREVSQHMSRHVTLIQFNLWKYAIITYILQLYDRLDYLEDVAHQAIIPWYIYDHLPSVMRIFHIHFHSYLSLIVPDFLYLSQSEHECLKYAERICPSLTCTYVPKTSLQSQLPAPLPSTDHTSLFAQPIRALCCIFVTHRQINAQFEFNIQVDIAKLFRAAVASLMTSGSIDANYPTQFDLSAPTKLADFTRRFYPPPTSIFSTYTGGSTLNSNNNNNSSSNTNLMPVSMPPESNATPSLLTSSAPPQLIPWPIRNGQHCLTGLFRFFAPPRSSFSTDPAIPPALPLHILLSCTPFYHGLTPMRTRLACSSRVRSWLRSHVSAGLLLAYFFPSPCYHSVVNILQFTTSNMHALTDWQHAGDSKISAGIWALSWSIQSNPVPICILPPQPESLQIDDSSSKPIDAPKPVKMTKLRAERALKKRLALEQEQQRQEEQKQQEREAQLTLLSTQPAHTSPINQFSIYSFNTPFDRSFTSLTQSLSNIQSVFRILSTSQLHPNTLRLFALNIHLVTLFALAASRGKFTSLPYGSALFGLAQETSDIDFNMVSTRTSVLFKKPTDRDSLESMSQSSRILPAIIRQFLRTHQRQVQPSQQPRKQRPCRNNALSDKKIAKQQGLLFFSALTRSGFVQSVQCSGSFLLRSISQQLHNAEATDEKQNVSTLQNNSHLLSTTLIKCLSFLDLCMQYIVNAAPEVLGTTTSSHRESTARFLYGLFQHHLPNIFAVKERVFGARVPLLAITTPLGIPTELCSSSSHNTMKTHFFKLCALICPEFLPLSLIIKKWFHANNLHGARVHLLNSYSIILMVVAFLQIKGKLPVLHLLQSDNPHILPGNPLYKMFGPSCDDPDPSFSTNKSPSPKTKTASSQRKQRQQSSKNEISSLPTSSSDAGTSLFPTEMQSIFDIPFEAHRDAASRFLFDSSHLPPFLNALPPLTHLAATLGWVMSPPLSSQELPLPSPPKSKSKKQRDGTADVVVPSLHIPIHPEHTFYPFDAVHPGYQNAPSAQTNIPRAPPIQQPYMPCTQSVLTPLPIYSLEQEQQQKACYEHLNSLAQRSFTALDWAFFSPPVEPTELPLSRVSSISPSLSQTNSENQSEITPQNNVSSQSSTPDHPLKSSLFAAQNMFSVFIGRDYDPSPQDVLFGLKKLAHRYNVQLPEHAPSTSDKNTHNTNDNPSKSTSQPERSLAKHSAPRIVVSKAVLAKDSTTSIPSSRPGRRRQQTTADPDFEVKNQYMENPDDLLNTPPQSPRHSFSSSDDDPNDDFIDPFLDSDEEFQSMMIESGAKPKAKSKSHSNTRSANDPNNKNNSNGDEDDDDDDDDDSSDDDALSTEISELQRALSISHPWYLLQSTPELEHLLESSSVSWNSVLELVSATLPSDTKYGGSLNWASTYHAESRLSFPSCPLSDLMDPSEFRAALFAALQPPQQESHVHRVSTVFSSSHTDLIINENASVANIQDVPSHLQSVFDITKLPSYFRDLSFSSLSPSQINLLRSVVELLRDFFLFYAFVFNPCLYKLSVRTGHLIPRAEIITIDDPIPDQNNSLLNNDAFFQSNSNSTSVDIGLALNPQSPHQTFTTPAPTTIFSPDDISFDLFIEDILDPDDNAARSINSQTLSRIMTSIRSTAVQALACPGQFLSSMFINTQDSSALPWPFSAPDLSDSIPSADSSTATPANKECSSKTSSPATKHTQIVPFDSTSPISYSSGHILLNSFLLNVAPAIAHNIGSFFIEEKPTTSQPDPEQVFGVDFEETTAYGASGIWDSPSQQFFVSTLSPNSVQSLVTKFSQQQSAASVAAPLQSGGSTTVPSPINIVIDMQSCGPPARLRYEEDVTSADRIDSQIVNSSIMAPGCIRDMIISSSVQIEKPAAAKTGFQAFKLKAPDSIGNARPAISATICSESNANQVSGTTQSNVIKTISDPKSAQKSIKRDKQQQPKPDIINALPESRVPVRALSNESSQSTPAHSSEHPSKVPKKHKSKNDNIQPQTSIPSSSSATTLTSSTTSTNLHSSKSKATSRSPKIPTPEHSITSHHTQTSSQTSSVTSGSASVSSSSFASNSNSSFSSTSTQSGHNKGFAAASSPFSNANRSKPFNQSSKASSDHLSDHFSPFFKREPAHCPIKLFSRTSHQQQNQSDDDSTDPYNELY